MAAALTYEKAHLIVAALRVLVHTNRKAPDEAAIAELLDWPVETVRTGLRHMEEHGVVAIVRTPFEARVELADHLRMEDLPRETAEPTMSTEVKQFLGGKKDKHSGIDKLFGSSDIADREKSRQADLDAKLKSFRSRTPGPEDLDDE